MLSLHTNAAALSTQNALGGTQKALTTSMSRLGTGFRINSAKDDAAGLQIATRLNAQSRGMAVAQRNTQNGISMLQTAEGALSEVSNMVLRMKDLATEAFNASTTVADKVALQGEYDALSKEISNIIRNTSFGGERLFSSGANTGVGVDGTTGKLGTAALTFQIGASAGETMSGDFRTQLTTMAGATGLGAISSHYLDHTVTALGTELAGTFATPGDYTSVNTPPANNTIITTLSGVLDKIGGMRSSLGAASNRLDHVFNNLSNIRTNTDQAKGRIMDVDYASETANMTTKQMLMQASTSMLKQSGSMSQLVMSLMQ